MKIPIPRTRRLGSRSFFHGACSVFCALVMTVVMWQTAEGESRTIQLRAYWDWGCGHVHRVHYEVRLAANGVCRIRGEGIDCLVTTDDVVARVAAFANRNGEHRDVPVILSCEELADWGVFFAVWERLREYPELRVEWGSLPLRSAL